MSEEVDGTGQKDYVILKQETKNTLEPPAYPHVLRILEMRATGVVVLEGSHAARCSRQLKDVAHCPLPILDTRLYPGRYYRGPSVHSAQCVGEGVMDQRWCFATNANAGIIYGAWIRRSWRCLVDRGRVTRTKVHASQFITAN